MAYAYVGEALVVAGLLAALLGWYFLKPEKVKRATIVVGLVGALIGVAAFGAFGLLAAVPGGAPPAAQGLWAVTILDTSDTDRAESSELISSDLHTITYSMGDADVDDIGDIDLNLRTLNLNSGLTTQMWVGSVSIVSMPTVLVAGDPTVVANYTVDLSRFAVTYSEDAGDGDVVQTGATAFFTATSGDLEDISIDLDCAVDGAFQSMAAGSMVSIIYSVGGVTITVNIADNGAVT